MIEQGHRFRCSLLLMVLVALTIRLVVVAFEYQGQLNPRRDHWPFGYETGRIARAIATGRGFSDPVTVGGGPTAWMTPVYPYLVAGVFKLFGIYSAPSAVILLSLSSLFSALTCIPVFLMARDSFGEKTAMWAGWIWAFFPYSIYFSAEWIWETCLTTLLLSLLFLITLHLERSRRVGPWLGYGLLWGVTLLTNPVVLSIFPVLMGWACYRSQRRGLVWGLPALVAALALMAVVTPWFVRNYEAFHKVVPLRDNFWLEVYVGNNGDISHSPLNALHPSLNSAEEEEYNRMGELRYMAEKRQQSLEFIRKHPSWFARVTLRRIVHTWTGFWSLPAHGPFQEPLDPEEPFDPLNVAFCTILTALVVMGLYLSSRRCLAGAWPYLLVLLAFPVVYYVTNTDPRYRHPMDPEMVVLAAYACATLLQRQNGVAREAGVPDARRKATPASAAEA